MAAMSTYCMHLIVSTKQYLCERDNIKFLSYGDVVRKQITDSTSLWLVAGKKGVRQERRIGSDQFFDCDSIRVLLRVHFVYRRASRAGLHALSGNDALNLSYVQGVRELGSERFHMDALPFSYCPGSDQASPVSCQGVYPGQHLPHLCMHRHLL